MGSSRDKGRPVTDAIERFHAVSSPRPSMGGLRCQTASLRLADAACMIRSQVSAFSVSVLIGSESLTAFRAIAHDPAHDQYRQFFARVLAPATAKRVY